MELKEIPSYARILHVIYKEGPRTFTELVSNPVIHLSRGTINTQLKKVQQQGYVEARFDGSRKLYDLTTKGLLQVESVVGKGDLIQRFRTHKMFEQRVRTVRDQFLARFEFLPNTLLIDCVDTYLDLDRTAFLRQLPSPDFALKFAYYYARFNLRHARSSRWFQAQTAIVQLRQKEFREWFQVDGVELNYFLKKWRAVRVFYWIPDDKGEPWFFPARDMAFETIMSWMAIRTERGTLQELLFGNFQFNVPDESLEVYKNLELGFQLSLDYSQQTNLMQLIGGLMRDFLQGHKGDTQPWAHLPTDPEELRALAGKLKTELAQVPENSPPQLDLFRTLHYIYANLHDEDESVKWGEEYLKRQPNDPDMLAIMLSVYFHYKRYDEFLRVAQKMLDSHNGELFSLMVLIPYYVEVSPDTQKAEAYIARAEKIITSEGNLGHFYPAILTFKARVAAQERDIPRAIALGEKAWKDYAVRDKELYDLLISLYKEAENWESLEDFCWQAYLENEYDYDVQTNLYYAHLKRGSTQKAAALLARVTKHFPDLLPRFDAIQQEIQGAKPPTPMPVRPKVAKNATPRKSVSLELACPICSERYPLDQAKRALERGQMKCSCGNDLTQTAHALLDSVEEN